MKFRYGLLLLILNLFTFVVADAYSMKIESMKINEKKANGASWDAFGKADLQIVVHQLSKIVENEYKSPVYKDTFSIPSVLDCGFTVIEGDEIKIVVYDIDLANNDLVGETTFTFSQENMASKTMELSFDSVSSMKIEFVSIFFNIKEQVEQDVFPEITLDLSTKPLIRWDFSKSYSLNYDLEEKVIADGSQVLYKSSLHLESKGDSTADINVNDIEVTTDVKVIDGASYTILNFREDGVRDDTATFSQNVMYGFFTLPSKNISLGETIEFPDTLPFKTRKGTLEIRGKCSIKFERYVKIKNRICAQLYIEIDMSDLENSDKMDVEYKFLGKSASMLYFDIEKRCMVLEICKSITETTRKQKSDGTVLSAMSDSLTRISLKE